MYSEIPYITPTSNHKTHNRDDEEQSPVMNFKRFKKNQNAVRARARTFKRHVPFDLRLVDVDAEFQITHEWLAQEKREADRKQSLEQLFLSKQKAVSAPVSSTTGSVLQKRQILRLLSPLAVFNFVSSTAMTHYISLHRRQA